MDRNGTHPPKRTPAPGINVGRYRLVERIGAGGMGEVWLADDPELQRRVALKFLADRYATDPVATSRFRHEARAMAALSHANIVTIHEVGDLGGRPYFVMEYVNGRSLKALLEKQELSLDRVVDLAIQVCSSLAEVHRADMTHRDLKPSNILIDEHDRAKLLDFGLATATHRDDQTTRTTTGAGTVSYMSPEQARGEDVDQRSDLFSFGVVLYQMLTRHVPFDRPNMLATLQAIINEGPQPLARLRLDVPVGLQRTVSRLLAKDPEQRFQTAEEVLQALRGEATAELPVAPNRRSRPSIAVLPLINMSADPEQEYFCDGMSEELIAALTQIGELHVAARTSAFAFKGRSEDVREIGRRLNVDTVLEGSVRKAGNRLRITVQLIDVADGFHLWSEKYDRDLEDVFAIQDEVTRAIVSKLTPTLLGEPDRPVVTAPTQDFDAYNHFLKGRFFVNKRTEQEVWKGLECFQAAIAADPNYALGHAGLAECYAVLASYALMPAADGYDKADAAASRAAELDDSQAPVQMILGVLAWEGRRDAEAAEAAYRRAIQLNPGYAVGHEVYSELLAALGREEESVALARRAAELDPLSLVSGIKIVNALYLARRYDEALDQVQRVLDMDHTFLPALLDLIWLDLETGRSAEALAAAREVAGIAPDNPVYVSALAYAAARAGHDDEARETLERLGLLARDRYVPSSELALVHAALGDIDRAFELLDASVDERYWRVLFIRVDPKYDPLREDPRFPLLLAKLGL